MLILVNVVPQSDATVANDGDYYQKQTTGLCGDNIRWTYDPSSKVLTISGAGKMWDAGSNGLWPYDPSHLMKTYYKISHIEMKGNITSIGDYVFKLTSAKTIKLPDTLESIGNNAFDGSYITSIEFPNSLKTVSNNAFTNCTNLSSIVFPSSMESIPFEINNFKNLKNVKLPDNLIDYDGFDGCINYIPDFSNCHLLESVTIRNIGHSDIFSIPNTVKVVNVMAPVVSSIKLGSNVSEFKSTCFSPESITVDPSNPYLNVNDGVLYTKDMKILVFYPSGKLNSTYAVPDSVETIVAMKNNNLKSLTVSSNIGAATNIQLKNLEVLNIPANTKKYITLPNELACVPIDYETTRIIENGTVIKYYSKYIDSIEATKLSDETYKIHINYNTDVEVKSIRIGSQFNSNDIQISNNNDFILNADISDYCKAYLSIETGEEDEVPPAEYQPKNEQSLWSMFTKGAAIVIVIIAVIGGAIGTTTYYLIVIR